MRLSWQVIGRVNSMLSKNIHLGMQTSQQMPLATHSCTLHHCIGTGCLVKWKLAQDRRYVGLEAQRCRAVVFQLTAQATVGAVVLYQMTRPTLQLRDAS